MNKYYLGLSAVLIPVALGVLPRAPFLPQEELAQLMPARSLVYIEGPKLAELLSTGLEHPFIAAILASELAQAALAEAPMQPEAALEFADAYLGQPVLATLAKLSSQGAAFSLGLKRGKPTYALALRGADPQLLRDTVERLLGKVAEQFKLPAEKLIEPHDRIRGVDVWYLGEELALAISDELLLASNDEGRLRDMLDLGAEEESERESLVTHADFLRLRAARRADATLWGFVDLAAIESETPEGGNKLRAMAHDPAVHFLLGPAVAALGSSRVLALELALADERLELSVAGSGLAEAAVQRVLFDADSVAPPLPKACAGDGGVALLYRDIAGLFRERTELFSAEVLPKFSESIANLAFLFGGSDVTDDVLPSLSPWLGLVVRDPLFRGAAVPDVKLPGAAFLLRLKDPEAMGERLTAGFQSLIGFINIDGAQKAHPPMVLDIELFEGVKISSAHFPPPKVGEGVDMRYNLEPACALIGDAFVLGTHASLVRSVVGQLGRGEIAPSANGRESLTLSGPVLSRTVEANAEALVMNAVLNDGKTMEVARGEIGGLQKLAAMIHALDFSTERPAADELKLTIALCLQGGDEK